MSRLLYHIAQDNLGNLLFDVSGTVRLAGTGILATIYGDEALTVILPNPMTNHPSFGSFKCFLPVGDFDFYMAKAGYTFETLTGVQGYGSMAQQDASTVAITGGTATLTGLVVNANITAHGLSVYDRGGNGVVGYYSELQAAGGTGRFAILLQNDAPSFLGGHVTLGATKSLLLGTGLTAPVYGGKIESVYDRSFATGIVVRPNADTGPGNAVGLLNSGGTLVGSITTTGAATAFNTASDARLKRAITPLTGALGVVQALRPVNFRWRSDDTPGRGFVAEEVQAVIPEGVITGEKDAGEEDGSIRPQMIDYSKLVPFLTAAIQDLAAQVAALTARLEAAGA